LPPLRRPGGAAGLVPRAHRDRQAGRQGPDDPRPGRARGRAGHSGGRGRAGRGDLPLLLRRRRDGQALRRGGLRHELRRQHHLLQCPAAAGSGRGRARRPAAGGNRRARPPPRPSPQSRTGESRPRPRWWPTPGARSPTSSRSRSRRCAGSSPRPASACSASGDTRPVTTDALLGPAETREIARRLGIRPAKRLGQNFVVDPGTVRRIAALAGVGPRAVVLEVGPGFGPLPLGLIGAARRVIAVEVDPALAAELPHTVAARAPEAAHRLDVVTGDAARVAHLPGEPPSVLAANLPYNVAVPVVLHLLATVPSLAR